MNPITLRQMRTRDQRLDAQITIRLSAAMLDKLVSAAERDQISTSTLARKYLASGLSQAMVPDGGMHGE